MKKITFTTIAVTLGIFMFSLPALAATTASFAPASLKVATGQQFNVAISVNSNGTSNYAEKIEVDFPADLLKVTSFNLGSNWMALTQSGYDSLDNTAGILIKTAGYPSGFSSSMPFGTISFQALKAGKGTIKIGPASSAFQANSQSLLTGTGISFTVTSASVPVNSSENTSVNITPISSINGEVIATATIATTSNLDNSQTAAAAEAVPVAGSTPWGWIVGAVVVLIIIGYGAYAVGKKGKS